MGAYELGSHIRGSSIPQQHLAPTGGVFEHRDAGSRWSQHNQLAVEGGISREYQMERTRFDSSGRTQLHPANRCLGAADLSKHPLHAQRRPGSTTAMVRPVEEEQEGVTAPLEQVAALSLGVRQQSPEHIVKEIAQLLGAFPAPSSQSLGEWSEASDVEQQEAPIDDSVGRPLLDGGPRGQQPRHVRRRSCALSERRQPGFAGAHGPTLNGQSLPN